MTDLPLALDRFEDGQGVELVESLDGSDDWSWGKPGEFAQAMRSCWQCNLAHDYMRGDRSRGFVCFDCGRLVKEGRFVPPELIDPPEEGSDLLALEADAVHEAVCPSPEGGK